MPNATYRNHGTHAEAIEIVFNPARISYRKLLEFFFQIHDPTTLNRQGNDRGLSYRSAIFYVNDEQKQVALDTIADVEASGLWPGRVTTELAPAGPFWEAEPEHQDYLERLPNGYTCHFIRPGWKLPVRKKIAPEQRSPQVSPDKSRIAWTPSPVRGMALVQAQRAAQSAERERVVKAFVSGGFRVGSRADAEIQHCGWRLHWRWSKLPRNLSSNALPGSPSCRQSCSMSWAACSRTWGPSGWRPTTELAASKRLAC